MDKDINDMKKLLKFTALSISSIASLIAVTNSHATSYQIFSGLSYANPAALNSIKEAELIVGGTTLVSQLHFNGTAAGVAGSTTSRTNDLLPYGRIAKRLSPEVVVSFDVTEPFYTNIQYPVTSLLAPFSIATVLRDVNYSPKVSYQVNPRLALGVGVDFNNFYNGQLNFGIPPLGDLTNKADSWAYGWDIGLFYVVTPATFLNLSYYSQIIQHAKGVSKWGPFVNNSLSADIKLPATASANVIQMLSPIWALSGTLRYTQWDIARYLVIQNTALPGGPTLTVPDKFFNNVSAQLATHYQFNKKWAGLAAFDYEPNVQPTWTRNPGLPTYTRYTPAIGAEYEITKGLKAKFIYAHPYSRAPINMFIGTGQHVQGTESVNVNAFDFSITYDV